jgi:hypothetical protein
MLNLDVIQKTFSFKIGKLEIEPAYWQAIAIVALLFILVLTLARLRRVYVNWSLKGSTSMMFLGFMLALIIEGFLLIGGRTLFTEIIGWEKAPKPLSTVLDAGRGRLINVLGVTQEIPQSTASEVPDAASIYRQYILLDLLEAQKAQELICKP